MPHNRYRDIKIFLGIFGTISLLFAAVLIFQYNSYRNNKNRLGEELFRHQDIITTMAAGRVQFYIHDIVNSLESLSVQIASSRDRSSYFEMMSGEYDELNGAVDGIALFGPEGGKIDSVSKNAALAFPDSARFEDYFAVPKQTAVTYISPMVKGKDGNDAVYISYPVRSAATGEFGGVVLAKISKHSFSRLCESLDGLSGAVRWTYFDQQAQQVFKDQCCAEIDAPKRDLMLSDTVKTEITQGVPASGYFGRVRVEYMPIMLEGYRWCLASEMRLDGLDSMAAADFRSMAAMSILMALFLAGGGIYSGHLYISKSKAETEASRQAALAAGAGALAAEKDMLRAVMDTLPSGIMLLDGQGALIGANKKMKEILGVPAEGTLAQVTSRAEGNGLLGPTEEDREMTVGDKTYRLIPVAVKAGTAGPHIREVRVLRDVTLEKSLEQKRADLVSMITHDVKSPLTVIMGITKWLEDEGAAGGMPDEMKSGVGTIRGAAKRVISLMDNFLFLSSVEGMRKMTKREVQLNAFLGRAVLEFSLEARKKNIKLEYSFPEHSPLVRMDETQMMRAVENLISNALKYTPEGGGVSVSARSYRDYVTISVTDNGPGISKDDMPRIFERRFRGKTAAAVPKGSGLGLTIVKAVVEAHGGAVDVSSEVGKGTTFTIRLPLGDRIV